jgi:hypothetical protein
MRTLLVRDSRNEKTGRVWLAIYRTHDTCPVSCPLYGAGCYGENRGTGGRPNLFATAERGTIVDQDYTALVAMLARAPDGAYVRANVVGDYLLDDGTPDRAYIDALNTAEGRLHVLSYTHAWRQLDPAWFTDSTRPAATRTALVAGWAPVIVTGDDAAYPIGETVGRKRVIVCPNVTHAVQCITCGLCARQERAVIAFPAHGTRKRAAAVAVAAAMVAVP